MFEEAGALISADFEAATEDKRVKAAIKYQPIARRLESLEDVVSEEG